MIQYRQANEADNQQLIELTANSGMSGDIGLRIDRKPDFFALLEMRGDTKVFVATENERVVGVICVSLQQVYVGGEIVPLHYIGDFKVDKKYRKRGIGLQLCNEMANYVISQGSDLAFLNVSKGNVTPLSFFKSRPNVPDFEDIGVFKIYQCIGKKNTPRYRNCIVESAEINDELINFFNKTYSQYQLGAVLTKESFKKTLIFKVSENEKLVAALCLIDTMPLKQNVVTRISWSMQLMITVVNLVSTSLNYSKIPVLHEPIKMMYIKYLAVENQDSELVKMVVNYARNLVYEKAYSFVSIGLHEKDQLHKSFSGIHKFTFKSVGMLLSLTDKKEIINTVKQGVPFEDYSLV